METERIAFTSLTLVAIGYDSYSDCWPAFGRCYQHNWPVHPFPALFVSPEKPFPPDYGVVAFLSGKEGGSFSSRLVEALKHVKTEYVILLLEDYLIVKGGDPEKWSELIREMKNKDLDFCLLQNFISKPKTKRKVEGSRIALFKTSSHYSMSLQPAIWKTNFLRSLTGSPCLRPWDFEVMLNHYCRESKDEVSSKIGYSTYTGFKVYNLIDKGKLTYGYKSLFKRMGLVKPAREEESYFERSRKRTRAFVSSVLGPKLRAKLKAIGKRHGKAYFTDD